MAGRLRPLDQRNRRVRWLSLVDRWDPLDPWLLVDLMGVVLIMLGGWLALSSDRGDLLVVVGAMTGTLGAALISGFDLIRKRR